MELAVYPVANPYEKKASIFIKEVRIPVGAEKGGNLEAGGNADMDKGKNIAASERENFEAIEKLAPHAVTGLLCQFSIPKQWADSELLELRLTLKKSGQVTIFIIFTRSI
jgi:hypothetical protein